MDQLPKSNYQFALAKVCFIHRHLKHLELLRNRFYLGATDLEVCRRSKMSGAKSAETNWRVPYQKNFYAGPLFGRYVFIYKVTLNESDSIISESGCYILCPPAASFSISITPSHNLIIESPSSSSSWRAFYVIAFPFRTGGCFGEVGQSDE